MQISREVCGFTGGEADTLRKAIGKKKLDVMDKMKVKFIDGAVANGVPQAGDRKILERPAGLRRLLLQQVALRLLRHDLLP